jgi:hypothetical protein
MDEPSVARGWALVLIWIAAAGAVAFVGSIWLDINYLLKEQQHLSSWVQAIGSIGAILGAAWIARRQSIQAAQEGRSAAVYMTRVVFAKLQAVTDLVRDWGR